MENPTSVPAPVEKSAPGLTFKVFGIGNAGISIIERLMDGGPPPSAFVAVHTEADRLAGSSALEKVHLETKLLQGLGSGGDPDRGRALAEEHAEKLKELCHGAGVIFLVAGLGGGGASGISPVIARLAKDSGALVLAFVTLPFECEGNRRGRFADQAIEELRELADGVICLPNQKVFGLINEGTGVREAFQLINQLLSDCARSLWRLVTHRGIIEIQLSELCGLLRQEHSDCAFAVAEAAGATRSREVVEKLLAHPLLDGSSVLSACHGVLVSIVGGPDLTMTEIDRIMQELNSRCGQAQVIVGAAIDELFQERVVLTVVAVRERTEPAQRESTARATVEDLDRQLLPGSGTSRPGSRFVPPPPTLPPDQVRQMLARQGGNHARTRKSMPRFRQGQLPLEIVSKGRFDKSEPTIYKGEDLDVPTYIRRGVSLN